MPRMFGIELQRSYIERMTRMIIVENGYVETKGTEEELFNDISSIASCFF